MEFCTTNLMATFRLSSSPINGPPSPLEKATATLCIAVFYIPSHTLGEGHFYSTESGVLTSNPRSRLACINFVTAPIHLREPAHCDVSCREPTRPCGLAEPRALTPDRSRVVGNHVCKYAHASSRSDRTSDTKISVARRLRFSPRVILRTKYRELSVALPSPRRGRWRRRRRMRMPRMDQASTPTPPCYPRVSLVAF